MAAGDMACLGQSRFFPSDQMMTVEQLFSCARCNGSNIPMS